MKFEVLNKNKWGYKNYKKQKFECKKHKYN